MSYGNWLRFVFGFALLAVHAAAQEPLHQRIDQVVSETSFGLQSPLASDADFIRRVHLDLVGRVPSAKDTRAFLDDASPTKRAALVDRLLASPQFARHWANVLDVMFMERRPDANVKAPEWQAYLLASAQQNKPFNQLAREILAAVPDNESLRPAAKFYLDRQVEPNSVTRDVGRVFFGMDLQCSQCHDHPLINDYYQADYYGLFALVSRTVLFTDKEKKVSLGEKGDGDAKFTSVFTKKSGLAGPRLPTGQPIPEPTFAKGDEYQVAPATDVRPVPKFSRRQQLAELATNGSNRAFNRNLANRLWAHLFGRGLVEPVDLHHSENPPTNPKLLDLLTTEIVALKFDTRAFLRELALSQAYQRSIEIPSPLPAVPGDLPQQLAALEAESQRLRGVEEASTKVVTDATAAMDAADKAAAPELEELTKTQTALGTAQTAAAQATKAVDDARKALAGKQDIATVLAAAAAKTQEAAQKLAGDKELAEVATKLTAKSTAFATEVAAATKKIDDLLPAVKTTGDAVAAAQQVVNAALEKTAPTRTQLAQQRQQLEALIEKLRTERQQTRFTESRLADAKALAAVGGEAGAIASAKAAADKLQADLVPIQQALAVMQPEAQKRQAEFAAAQKAREDAAKALAESQQQLAAKQDAAKSVADALAQAEAAKQKLPNDAEVAQAATVVKTKSDQVNAEIAELQKLIVTRDQTVKSTTDAMTAAQQALTTAMNQLAATQQQLAAATEQAKQAREKADAAVAGAGRARQEVLDRWSNRFQIGLLRPMTAEQLAWSLMQATGVVEQHTPSAEAEMNQKAPLDPAMPNDPAKLAARGAVFEASLHGKLAGNVSQFVNLFANSGGQPQHVFFATVDQSLFFANGATVRSWLGPSGGNLTDRMMKLEDPKAVAEELYVSVFARRPTEAESADVVKYLTARPMEKTVVVQELAWGLLTSAEFRFNH